MKRTEPIRHLERHDRVLVREGSKHSVYLNPAVRKISIVPRHTDFNEFLARKIRCDLGVPTPKA